MEWIFPISSNVQLSPFEIKINISYSNSIVSMNFGIQI